VEDTEIENEGRGDRDTSYKREREEKGRGDRERQSNIIQDETIGRRATER
jgi:hypothetical protein